MPGTSRDFLTETGQTPQHFVGGSATLDQLAERTGLGSTESLRRLFQRELGVTPGAYRHRFKTTTAR